MWSLFIKLFREVVIKHYYITAWNTLVQQNDAKYRVNYESLQKKGFFQLGVVMKSVKIFVHTLSSSIAKHIKSANEKLQT